MYDNKKGKYHCFKHKIEPQYIHNSCIGSCRIYELNFVILAVPNFLKALDYLFFLNRLLMLIMKSQYFRRDFLQFQYPEGKSTLPLRSFQRGQSEEECWRHTMQPKTFMVVLRGVIRQLLLDLWKPWTLSSPRILSVHQLVRNLSWPNKLHLLFITLSVKYMRIVMITYLEMCQFITAWVLWAKGRT